MHDNRIDACLAPLIRGPHDSLLIEKGAPEACDVGAFSEPRRLPDQLPLLLSNHGLLAPAKNKHPTSLRRDLKLAGHCGQAASFIVAQGKAASNLPHVLFLVLLKMLP